MGCGASNDTSRVQKPTTLNKKSVLPAIEQNTKTKTPSAKSNGSNDSGIEDSEPIKPMRNPSKISVPADALQVEHHQKSRLGHAETFDIIVAQRPGRLAPLNHAPKFIMNKQTTATDETDLKVKLAEKQERASRKRQEIEEARRLASSRIGHRTTTEPMTPMSKRDERHQHLSMLRDQLRQNPNNQNHYDPPLHTPRSARTDSATSGMGDIENVTPRRGGFVLGATKSSNFKPVYD